jgi:hypothetical protein
MNAMKLYRRLSLAFFVVAIGLIASSAQAIVAINMIVTDTSGAGTISPDGLTVTNAALGDTITVVIEVDNTDADSIQSLFTSMQFSADGLDVDTAGSLSTILLEPGFGGPSLGIVAQPQPVFGGAPGEWIALAHASTGSPTQATGPEITTQIIFSVTATSGAPTVVGFLGPGDSSVINGNDNNSVSAPDMEFSDAIIINVPEPSAMMASMASLLAVAGVVAVRRQ